jgi:ABC-type glycerol-3-phosphate transport system substrate-binding protein
VRTRALAAAAAAALALAGCHAVRYDAGRPPSQRRYERTIHFWLWGFKGDGRVDLDAACPEGVATFKSEATPLGWVAQVLTVGFWSPRRVVVVCAEGR